MNGFDLFTTYFIIPYFIRPLFAKLDETMTGYYDEGFPFAVMPVFALGNSWLGDVDTYLAIVKGMDKLRK